MKQLSDFRTRLIAKGYSERSVVQAMVRSRNLVKNYFRGGIKSSYHSPTYNQLSTVKTDAQIIQGATRTNSGVNWMLGAK